jgi:hypothetical protein
MLSFAKDIAIILGGIIALFTFINGLLEYKRQGSQKRVEHFVTLRRRLKENPSFKEICSLLSDNSPLLAEYDAQDKRDFLGLMEEVAMLTNSGLIRREVAHYMFGSYAVMCQESEFFWHNVDKDDIYWTLFHEFARSMKLEQDRFRFNAGKLRY